MNFYLLRSVLMLSLPLVASNSFSAEVRDDYELTVAIVAKAMRGMELYEDKQFAGSFNDGCYTDPDPKTKVKDFWTNGQMAKLDFDGNGHFETLFAVVDNELVYAGSIGGKGRVVHAASAFKQCLGRPVQFLIEHLVR